MLGIEKSLPGFDLVYAVVSSRMRAGRMLRTPALNREPVRVTYTLNLAPLSRHIHFWAAMLALARDCEEICFRQHLLPQPRVGTCPEIGCNSHYSFIPGKCSLAYCSQACEIGLASLYLRNSSFSSGGGTNLCWLANLLTNDLPLIVLVLLDCRHESLAL